MDRPLASRKRNAPGAAPLPQPQELHASPYVSETPVALDSNFGNWDAVNGVNNLNNGFVPNPVISAGIDYDSMLTDASTLGDLSSQSGQMVRRQQQDNQQVVPVNTTDWQDPAGDLASVAEFVRQDDEEDLERKAMEAKKEAQAKRKQIPPFVQKLSSFLDDNTNADLIRWSDAGDSFIVLDEDEFARKLIPELFKHNNYASFVRQLNMYGFHKKVGLSDNSMKASENKRKTPSEYYNKYFRRGRPELLWLIHKPKNPPAAKRKRDEKSAGESDDERKPIPTTENRPSIGQRQPSTDVAVLPRSELNSLRQDLANLQKKQQMITQFISQMKQQNNQLATAFQEMHQRHENSINAILTFLATFYNRSLDGQSDMSELFNNHPLPHGNVQPGNIVDMGDLKGEQVQMPLRRPKQQLLLPAPEARAVGPASNSPITMPSSSTASPRVRNVPSTNHTQTTIATPLEPAAPTPPLKYEADSPQGMMSMINAANSASPNAGPGLDFDSALDDLQHGGGNMPLTPQQRNDMLSLMQASMGGPGENLTGLAPPSTHGLSPLDQITQSNQNLDWIQQLQRAQGEEVQLLENRVRSLSPLGVWPGADPGNPPPDFNLDDWMLPPPNDGLDAEMAFADLTADGIDAFGPSSMSDDANNDVRNGLGDSGGRVESLSSRETTASPQQMASLPNHPNSPKKRKREG